MPTTEPLPPLPTEALITLCTESLSQAKRALEHATARQFPHLAAHIRASTKQQLHTLLLLDRRANRADIHCAFHALAHIRKPWIIDTYWQAKLSTHDLPLLYGIPAARFLQHLYRAILLGHAPLDLLPSRNHESHQLISVHLAPSPDTTTLLETLASLRARIETLQHPRPSRTKPVREQTLIATVARGRNRWFRATHNTCKLETVVTNSKELLITYALKSHRPGSFPPIYIKWSLPDAQTHAQQLLALLRRTPFRITPPRPRHRAKRTQTSASTPLHP